MYNDVGRVMMWFNSFLCSFYSCLIGFSIQGGDVNRQIDILDEKTIRKTTR